MADPTGGRVVLVVEDDDDHAELIRRGFERAGVAATLHRLKDGDAATGYLQAASERELGQISTIIVDLKLPRKSGLELLSELKGHPRTSTIPAVVLTTSQSESDLEAAYAANVNSYLVKPTEPTRFLAIVQQVAKYWVEHNRRP